MGTGVVVETEVLGQVGSEAGGRRRAPDVLDVEVVGRALVQLLAKTHGSRTAGGCREVRVTENVPTPARNRHRAVQSR